MKYQTIIGLEIHIQAKTKSKMFCSCAADYFGDEPNTHVCPVCLGLPGALPVPNKAAIDQCIKLALALNCSINQETKFDRKNYFYPDLPKGYQISQYDLPIGYEGFLEIDVEGDSRRIRITRVHMEEDTGKSMHEGTQTLLDFNKSGMPLIEVVTEPDFADLAEVTAFAKLLKQTVEYLGVSDAEMQKGQMRFELNISLKKPEKQGLPNYKIEVKNIGSISVLEKVIEFEVARQGAILDRGEVITNETRGLKDMTGETVSQRVKETADDYRYFPEPDIPPIHISNQHIETIRATMSELPAVRKQRYMDAWGLESEQAEILVEQSDKGDWFDQLTKEYNLEQTEVKEVVKWFVGDVSGLMEKQSIRLVDSPLSANDLVYLVKSLLSHQISGTIFKKVLEEMFAVGGSAESIIQEQGLVQVTDDTEIQKWIEQVISENQTIVANIEKNPNAVKSLIGLVMRLSQGKANPQLVDKLLRERFEV